MKRTFLFFCALLMVLCFILPVIWLYLTAFKDRVDLFALPPKLFFRPTLSNFNVAFVEREFYRPVLSSIYYSMTSTALALALSILAGYSFSRMKTKGKRTIFFLLFSVQILPPVIIILPLFLIFSRLEILGTSFPLSIVYVAMLIPFGTALLKGYFDKMTIRYEEVALLEGMSFWFFFLRVFIREARMPILVTGFFMFLMCWNEFLFSMIFSTIDTSTLPVSVLGLITPVGTFWGQIAAVTLVSSAPIVILSYVFRKHLLSGFSFGIVTEELPWKS